MPYRTLHTEPLVLIVDDQPANLQLLGKILSSAGYEVMPADSGEQALARAKTRIPDLVLLDMLMPGMDGFEVCRRMKEDVLLAPTPVIFITAATEREFLVRAFELHAVDYITKPFVAEELLARVRTHVNLKRANDHLRLIVREREDVTTIVAHDLKNPISNVRFAAQLLRRPNLTDERRDGLTEDIVSSCDEALEFIHRFLSRRAEIERVRALQLASADLGELVDRAIARQSALAESRGVRLVRSGESLAAHGDAAALRNVLQNLLSNAIRFAPPETEIEVRIDASRTGFARVYVMDRGPGVPETERQKLFQRFARIAHANSDAANAAAAQAEVRAATAHAQAEIAIANAVVADVEANAAVAVAIAATAGEDSFDVNSTSADPDPPSTGLGLAIAKGDLEQMNGFLWYEPRNGGGSVFAFELPLTAS
ncbi:MAG: hybrid sensor histidine kinase/response regulator [Tahibacter sp.]